MISRNVISHKINTMARITQTTTKSSSKGVTKRRPSQKKSSSGLVRQARAVGAIAGSNNTPELKNVDAGNTLTINSGLSTWSTPQLLNGISQGAGSDERIGRKITLKSLLFRWVFSVTGTPTAGTHTVAPYRIVIFYDKAPNGVAPSMTELFTASNINAIVNLGYKDRFVILRDFYPQRDQQATPNWDNGFWSLAGSEFVKLPNLDQQFIATGNTISSIGTGAIYWSWVTTANTIVPTTSRIDVACRIRFTDN